MTCFVVAEVGPNHNGNIDTAMEMVRRIAGTGADAVKFQLSQPERVLSRDAFRAQYQEGNDNHEDLLEASRLRQLSRSQHHKLQKYCADVGIEYMCTAFDLESLQFLDVELGVQRFKVASGELLTVDMSDYISASTKPAIVSTGMASEDEIAEAYVRFNPDGLREKITLLHCVSNYPADPSLVNLRWLPVMARRFDTPVGYSDHTLGNEVSLAAVALGAAVIEKHVTLDKSLPGPDHKASATIPEFSALVSSIRTVEASLGQAKKIVSQMEEAVALAARKSIVSSIDIPPGIVLSEDQICFKRPGTGFLPTQMSKVIGRTTRTSIPRDRVILPEHLQ